MKIRGFELITQEMKKNTEVAILPYQKTIHSAGYDFHSPIKVIIPGKNKITVWTDIKSYMKEDEVLLLYIRSSLGIKKSITLANGTGVIDSDYYNNKSNEGNIGICLQNNSEKEIIIEKNEAVAQGVFVKYLKSDNGNSEDKREGGIGSTNKQKIEKC